MKKIIFLLCVLCAYVGNLNAQTTYDVFTYSEPKGYKKEIGKDYISYTKTDTKTGTYCIISLYKQTASSGDIVKDFEDDWKTLVVPMGVNDTPQKEAGNDLNGWKTYAGGANFEFNGNTNMVMLNEAKKDNANVAIIVVTNSNDMLEKEANPILAKLKLGKPKTFIVNANTIKTKPENTETADKKIELWMSLKLTGVSSGVYGDIPSDAADAEFYALFPNGDYYPHYHFEGMGNAIMTPNSDDSWGKYNSSGNKINFKSKYDAFVIEKKTATKYSKTGSVFTFYKCASVDGLKLEGGWSSIPNWSTNDYFKQEGSRRVIYFEKNGTFKDRGIFVSNSDYPNQYPKDAPGSGTYSINNFTLTLNYADGRRRTCALTGNFDKNPATDNRILYIAGNLYYNK